MSQNNEITKEIYDLLMEYYKYEQLIKNKSDQEKVGYLINKDSIEKLKKQICYEEFKKNLKDNYQIRQLKKTIENKCILQKTKNHIYDYKSIEVELKEKRPNFSKELNKIKKEMIPKNFNNKQDLINSLNNNNKYYIINSNFWYKIKENEISIEQNVKFLFRKNKLILILNNKEELSFNINNGIIEKSSLIENEYSIIKVNTIDETGKKEKYNSDDINKFKEDIEILIRLYYYYKELKEKENENFQDLKENTNRETFYLINKSWIEKYFAFYEYNELAKYLNSIKGKKNNNNFPDLLNQNNNFISNESISNIIKNLPDDYIKKMIIKK